MTPAAALVAIVMVLGGLSASGGYAQSEAPAGSVTIDGTKYTWGKTTWLLSLVPQPAVRRAIAVISKCQGLQSYGFVRFRGVKRPDFGLVAWAPTSIVECIDPTTEGGGAGSAGSLSPCIQVYRTTPNTNPVGAQPQNAPSGSQRFVLIAASTTDMCAHLSTQVPGGVWARHNTSGDSFLIKCQHYTSNGGLEDYVAPYTSTLPAHKPASQTGYINDDDLATNASRIQGVPSCSGFSLDVS